MDRKKIGLILDQYVQKIKPFVNPQRVILYGSYARGTATDWSDIDIVIVADYKKSKEFELMNKLSSIGASIDNELIFDVRVMKEKDFKELSHLSSLSEAKKEGIIIYSN